MTSARMGPRWKPLDSRSLPAGAHGQLLEETVLREFHDFDAKVVVLTRSGDMVTVVYGGDVERVEPLLKVHLENATGTRDAFWLGLLVARLDGKDRADCVRFAHEVTSLKLRVESHVERAIDRAGFYTRLEIPVEQGA